MEQDLQVFPSNKSVSSEPGKECIEMETIGKIENSGMYCNQGDSRKE